MLPSMENPKGLRAIRLSRRLTQAQVAAMARTTQRTVSQIEHGTRPRSDTLLRLAHALGVTCEEVIGTVQS